MAVISGCRAACERTIHLVIGAVHTAGCLLSGGLDSDGAELLLLGENAICRLSRAGVAVRIARSADRLARVPKELLCRPMAGTLVS
jgi:hypothetical protein